MPATLQQSLQAAVDQFQSGNLEAAGGLCSAILSERPDEATALHLLGAVRLRQNDPATAIDLLSRALKRDGRNAELMANLGAAHRAAGKPENAVSVLKKAVKIAPASATAHFNFANALSDCGDVGKAIRHYRRTLQIVSDHPGARRCLAALLASSDQSEDALAEYETLARLTPDDPEVLNAIGALRAADGDEAGAEETLRKAHGLAPAGTEIAADIAANLANVLACGFRYDESLALHATATAVRPADADGFSNMANVYRRQGDLDRATVTYEMALTLDPDHIDASSGLANCLLAAGRYASGWRQYLRRASVRAAESSLFRGPIADDLGGRTLTVLADQGLGDEIFFLRFAPALKARGARIAYRPEPRLAPMLARAGIVDDILPPDTEVPDCQGIAVGDLPYLLGMQDGDTPPPTIHLPAEPAREDALRATLSSFGPPPWIGVTWRAGTANRQRLLFKEAPAEVLARALPRDATIVAVQRGALPGEIGRFAATLGRDVPDLSATNDDLEDLLALSGLLDGYVAVSNTMVHMRASRGRKSHVLVPAPAEFRWMADGAESPWFPGSPIYRQQPNGDWTTAAADLENALEHAVETEPC